ncbi:hypothetical protein C8A05DRAFT_41804 [Staphylotrichum tortipilum]|uniref:Sorting nexin MVP1 n=1 Tax=Staphylotrichum tortipilum TaxID=2831512 RepID=A0AAN6MRN5_9PEZI|nr:hypothetical protein C8A05DRAFT_41804 [Staphylotrichum longicolle]
MPPRLPFAQAARCCAAAVEAQQRPATTSLVSLFAGLSTRSASILASLSDNKGAYNKRIRVGRGPSSGYGKTSGRGQKGRKARGRVNPWFQGGQTPLIVSHGRHGFINHRATDYSELNLEKLQIWIDKGRIDPTKQITPREIMKSGVVGHRIRDGIKLLARGELRTPIDIMVSRASAAAIKAVEDVGGKITTRFYTKQAIRRLVRGESEHTDTPLPVGAEHVEGIVAKARGRKKHFYRLPDPTSRDEIEYYRDIAHRGYLSHQVKPGQSPSLYFKVPVGGLVVPKPPSKEQIAELKDKLCSPPDDPSDPLRSASSFAAANNRSSLFEDEPPMTRSTTTALFADDDGPEDHQSPWDLPTPRKPQTRAELLRGLLPSGDVPEGYVEAFDAVAGGARVVDAGGVARTLAAAKLGADAQARIMGIAVVPAREGEEVALDRNQFNVLLALVGLAQEGEVVSLDSVDERRHNLPRPDLHGLIPSSAAALPNLDELVAKPPQRPATVPNATAALPDDLAPSSSPSSPRRHRGSVRRSLMDYPEDPWNTPDVHRGHNHGPEPPRVSNSNGHDVVPSAAVAAPPVLPAATNGNVFGTSPQATLPRRTTSAFTTSAPPSGAGSVADSASAWGFYDGNVQPSAAGGGGFGDPSPGLAAPFGGIGGGLPTTREEASALPGAGVPAAVVTPNRTIGGGGGRGGMGGVEENILVTLMPEKEGMFLFQHHNYEVMSSRKGSKVVRRYSDFVWLLDCLHKRYPFRVLPLLPPKRVAVNGNHLSNDGAFIEKRRRGLARFLNALVRHPVLSQEQLVIMFLTVPTELAVWRKQATISVQDEFTGRSLPPGLEDSLPPAPLEELFARTRSGVKRSAELYITVASLTDRLVKRTEGVAADHARIAVSLVSLTGVSADTYAAAPDDVPLLNDGLQAMSRHLRNAQGLMEDEARAWDQGVLEDLKRQRDGLVSLRELFERRERLDRDNIPFLERRIQQNEGKLAGLRAKPEGVVKPGEVEKVVEAIIKYAEMLADNWRRLLDGLEGMPLGE